MTSGEKSPNMMSTTGRIPVMAAPTAIPVNPASEIGVSRTRSFPNSSTSPVRTLNTVPASAMSSPQMKTRESRRISSAIASRTASLNVSSRVSGINVLIHLVLFRIWSSERKFGGFVHLRLYVGMELIQTDLVGEILRHQPIAEQFNRITFGFPRLFFLLGTIVLAVDVPDVVAKEPIRVAQQECRPRAGPCPGDDCFGGVVDSANVLSINALAMYTERT